MMKSKAMLAMAHNRELERRTAHLSDVSEALIALTEQVGALKVQVIELEARLSELEGDRG